MIKKPIVTLIGATGWDGTSTGGTLMPLRLIASQILNMKGEMHTNMHDISDEQAISLVRDLKKTALAGALETIDLLFQMENVPRSLTHQLVRTRVGATYHQESLRFTTRKDGFDYDIGPTVLKDEQAKFIFKDLMSADAEVYKKLVESGVSTEDARGVLPIATLTKVGVKYNLKTLIHAANVRLCYQSQGHWKSIFQQIKTEVSTKIHPVLAEFLEPICSSTGRCEYKSMFDRVCPIEQTLIANTCKGCSLDCSGSYCNALKTMHRLEG